MMLKRGLKYLLIAPIVMGISLLMGGNASAATYTVTSTADSGAGSLRQAMTDANSNSGADQINFNITGVGLQTITLSSGLPYVSEQLSINGLTQPSSECDAPLVSLNVNGQANPFVFSSTATGSEVNGLALYGSITNVAALTVDSPDTTVRCNFFGTTDGSTSINPGINKDWLNIAGDNATIGGNSSSDRNVFLNSGGNVAALVNDSDVSSITIKNNYVGVDITGANYVVGPSIGFDFYTVITSAIIEDNVIATSGGPGISFAFVSSGSSGVVVRGNMIGTDASGMVGFASTDKGISFVGSFIAPLIEDNTISSDVGSGNAALDFINGQVSSATIRNNNINVSADGTTAFNVTSRGIQSSDTNAGSSDWLITGNTIFSKAISILTEGTSVNYTITNNTIGMDSTRTNCFADQGRGIVLSGQKDSVVGGTGASDANFVCTGTGRKGIEIPGALIDNVSVLRNSVTSGDTALAVSSPALTTPIIRSSEVNGANTDVTFELDLPAGSYRVEFYENSSVSGPDGTPQLNTYLQSFNITSSGALEQFTRTLTGNGYDYLALTATEIDLSADGFGTTSRVGTFSFYTDLEVSTDGATPQVEEDATGFEITQVITNLGPTDITDINFSLLSSNCYTLNSTSTSGDATTPGTYSASSWSGVLEVGQTLILTHSGDVTCSAGQQVEFYNEINVIEADGVPVEDLDQSNEVYGSYNIIIIPQVDLAIETTDGVSEVLQGTTGHIITQTLTNNGPHTITEIDFSTAGSACIDINSVTPSGSATITGAYIGEYWTGQLEPAQELVLTFDVDIICPAGDEMVLEHYIDGILDDNAAPIGNDSSTVDINDTSLIYTPITDVSISKVLENPEDLAVGATLDYTITYTNLGTADFDIGAYDGSGNPFETSLFLDVSPPDLALVSGSSTNPDLTCDYLAPAAVGGTIFAAHSDHSINGCSYTGGGSYVLSADESISTTISMTVEIGSDLSFTNHVMAPFIAGDPDADVLIEPFNSGGPECGVDPDAIDCYRLTRVNNYAGSEPVADISVSKELVQPAVNTPGATISYDITLDNAGPMEVNLFDLYSQNTATLLDIYPGADLTFVGTNNTDLQCLDLGPGSTAFLGGFAVDHPNHQLLICDYRDLDYYLPSGDSITMRLNFTVDQGASNDFVNYVLGALSLSTDPDAEFLFSTAFNSQSDQLETLVNGNFAKAAFAATDTDDDTPGGVNGNTGTTSGTEGVASTGENSFILVLITLGLLLISAVGLTARIASNRARN